MANKRIIWKKVSREEYKSIPHEWVRRSPEDPEQWDRLAERIRLHSKPMMWRGQKYRYWINRGMCYWKIGYVINRSFESALDNGGYPGKEAQRKIFNRFWGGK